MLTIGHEVRTVQLEQHALTSRDLCTSLAHPFEGPPPCCSPKRRTRGRVPHSRARKKSRVDCSTPTFDCAGDLEQGLSSLAPQRTSLSMRTRDLNLCAWSRKEPPVAIEKSVFSTVAR